MTTKILDDIDRQMFGYVAEWACSRRYYSILRGKIKQLLCIYDLMQTDNYCRSIILP